MCCNFLCKQSKESARNLHSRLGYAKQKVLQENIPYSALNCSTCTTALQAQEEMLVNVKRLLAPIGFVINSLSFLVKVLRKVRCSLHIK